MIELAKQAPSPPVIRAATEDDVLAIAHVHILSWRETYPGLLPASMLAELSIAREAIRWQRIFDHPQESGGTLAFVADQEGRAVAYGSCNDRRSRPLHDGGYTGEISELYVLRQAQRQGAGSMLMTAMATTLLALGHRAMSLWVLEQNGPARRFYESLGGTMIAAKRGGLPEVAYGWSDLRTLTAPRAR